jgi:hypothetical protein
MQTNRATGWASIAVGIGVGLIMGMWSFDGPLPVPQWLGEYGDTSRRLARLGHIAFIGLGILNILLARELMQSSLDARRKRLASAAMNFGNIVLPLALFAAAAWRPAKYVMGLPATAVFIALVLAAWGARHSTGGGFHRD